MQLHHLVVLHRQVVAGPLEVSDLSITWRDGCHSRSETAVNQAARRRAIRQREGGQSHGETAVNHAVRRLSITRQEGAQSQLSIRQRVVMAAACA